jgi:hypothetical protein
MRSSNCLRSGGRSAEFDSVIQNPKFDSAGAWMSSNLLSEAPASVLVVTRAQQVTDIWRIDDGDE